MLVGPLVSASWCWWALWGLIQGPGFCWFVLGAVVKAVDLAPAIGSALGAPKLLSARLSLRAILPHWCHPWQPGGTARPSSLWFGKFPFYKKKKLQRSPRCLLKAAFKLLHSGPRGQPCAAAAP